MSVTSTNMANKSQMIRSGTLPLLPSTPTLRKSASLPTLALYACVNCKTRKKGCDKRLPKCGHCSKRSVPCRYIGPSKERKLEDSQSPYLFDKLLPVNHTGSVPNQSFKMTDIHSSVRSSSVFIDSFSAAIKSNHLNTSGLGEITIDHILRSQVDQITRSRGCYIDDISSAYFQGVQSWLPVISRNLFHHEFVNSPTCWPADFSLLLLTMFLVTWQPPTEALDELETLYVVTKMLFSQVQATCVLSTRLVQAGLLISIFEYARGLGNAAFLSIGLCARMATTIGLYRRRDNVIAHLNNESKYRRDEENNVWWGIVIYERVIACSAGTFSEPICTRFPSTEDELPSEFEVLSQSACNEINFVKYRLGDLRNEDIGAFGREAQAAYLLQRIFNAITTDDTKATPEDISSLDSDVQTFLSLVMKQSGGTWGFCCGSVAITINALLLLHQFILAQSSGSYHFGTPEETSVAAVDTVIRIVIDIAYSFGQNVPSAELDIFPPMCLYLVRVVLQEFHKTNKLNNPTWSNDLRELNKWLEYHNKRWSISK